MDTEPSKNLYKAIVIGYAIGAGILFLPLFILSGFQALAAQADIGLVRALGFLVLLPIILVLQGAIIGGLVLLGLWVLRKIRPSISLQDKLP